MPDIRRPSKLRARRASGCRWIRAGEQARRRQLFATGDAGGTRAAPAPDAEMRESGHHRRRRDDHFEDGRIESVGKRGGNRTSDCAIMIDAGGCVVLPGFVDAHTHPVFAGNRANEFEQRAMGATYAGNRGGGRGHSLHGSSNARRDRRPTRPGRPEYVRWFLEGGTTTIEAKSGYGLTLGRRIQAAARHPRDSSRCAPCRRFSARTKSRTNSEAVRRSTSTLVVRGNAARK